MKPFALAFRTSIVRLLGFALLSSFLNPPAFGAGVTVRFVGEPKKWDESVRPWMEAVTEE